jgi:DNA-binding CsgD family transcriptional regulator
MKIWDQLLAIFKLKNRTRSRQIDLDENLLSMLTDIAFREQRSPRKIQADLLATGLAYRHKRADLWQRWQSLSPRETEIAALTCLGYTNRQIAARLNLSPDTVKGYVHQVLVKFKLHSKSELQLLLSDWDFSPWGQRAL